MYLFLNLFLRIKVKWGVQKKHCENIVIKGKVLHPLFKLFSLLLTKFVGLTLFEVKQKAPQIIKSKY